MDKLTVNILSVCNLAFHKDFVYLNSLIKNQIKS